MGYHEQAYNEIKSVQVPGEQHKAAWTHDLIAAAAAFEAMHYYNKKKAEKGEEENHGLAKEMIAGLAGASIDHFVETKGLDWIDHEKAKRHARIEAEKLYAEQTGVQL
ncbi:hypothetical protein BDF14DRAFT_1840316 [Spinellus fusiger]|nr:hypothetical protein BDF14DRAFT_1840316 [Spinellus fusiger]